MWLLCFIRANQERYLITTGFLLDDIKKYYDESIYSEIEVNYTDIYLVLGYNEIYFYLNDGKYIFEPMVVHGISIITKYSIYIYFLWG